MHDEGMVRLALPLLPCHKPRCRMLPLVQSKTGADAFCTVNARAAGGQVFEGITAVDETSCPAGSYGVDNQYCLPW